MKNIDEFEPFSLIEEEIKKNGGLVNSHSHLDRAFTLNSSNFKISSVSLKTKWNYISEFNKTRSVDDIYSCASKAIEQQIKQGVKAIGTFIDFDPIVKDKAFIALNKARDFYSKDIKIKIINQTIKGVVKKDAFKWFIEASKYVDIIGSLPAKDQGLENEHLDIVFETAKSLNKMIHVHVDQNNLPLEDETSLLIKKTKEYKMFGKVCAIHGISIGAKEKNIRKLIYKGLKSSGISFIACPSAWIDSPRREFMSPIHNSITPIDEMSKNKICVAFGTDNIQDIYLPFANGDLRREIWLGSVGNRFYKIKEIAEMASINGRKVLGL